MFLNGASDIMGLFSSMISGSSAQKYLCRKTGGVGLAVGRCLCLPGTNVSLLKYKWLDAPLLSSSLKKFSVSSAVFWIPKISPKWLEIP